MATAGSRVDGTPSDVARRRLGLVLTLGVTLTLGAMVVAGVAPRWVPTLGVLLVWRIVVYWNLVNSTRDDPMNPYYLLGPDP